jgi:hypothetical protein
MSLHQTSSPCSTQSSSLWSHMQGHDILHPSQSLLLHLIIVSPHDYIHHSLYWFNLVISTTGALYGYPLWKDSIKHVLFISREAQVPLDLLFFVRPILDMSCSVAPCTAYDLHQLFCYVQALSPLVFFVQLPNVLLVY